MSDPTHTYEVTDIKTPGYYEAYYNGEKIRREDEGHSGNHESLTEAQQTIFWHIQNKLVPEGKQEYEIRKPSTFMEFEVNAEEEEDVSLVLMGGGVGGGPITPPASGNGITGTVQDGQSIVIASDGVNNFGADAPTVRLWDDGRNQSDGQTPGLTSPHIGEAYGQTNGMEASSTHSRSKGISRLQVKQRIPHLRASEVAMIESEVTKIAGRIANHDFDESAA